MSLKPATRCVNFPNSDEHGAVAPPIYQTATFRQPGALEFGEYDYTRSGNPTRHLLEQQIAELEGGAHASAFASGMAAITALARIFNSGDEIVAGDDLYGGTVRLLESVLSRQAMAVRYVDTTDLAAVRAAVSARTKLILIETPSNPLLRISDIRGLSQIATEAGALLAVDNSMLSPILQQPLSLGADFVIHSATKFLCGHSDVTAGAVVTNDRVLHERIAFQQNAEGAALAPFESWLLLRGLKTLALRVERQNESALKIAQFLKNNETIRSVYYPGLSDHPGHQLQRSQAEGDGSVITFTTGNAELSRKIVEGTKLFTIAVSFGSVGSTISLPCRMSHASIPFDLREKLAPPEDLIRLSVGIEDPGDLIEDLGRALAAAEQQSGHESLAAAVSVA
ncbi:MAG TPA: aminotransferase class V-fold PLP-dependent enzyme [Pyrinomonadaceae bacterium]|nr:aminotransferase class V-fold PLP-dependent enzyme [Pyrinomonadaceae bacterium]